MMLKRGAFFASRVTSVANQCGGIQLLTQINRIAMVCYHFIDGLCKLRNFKYTALLNSTKYSGTVLQFQCLVGPFSGNVGTIQMFSAFQYRKPLQKDALNKVDCNPVPSASTLKIFS